MRNHVNPELLREMRSTTAKLHVADFADRLMAIADDQARVRAHANENNDGRLLLQASAYERDTLLVLMERLGIDDEETHVCIDEAKALARALAAVLRTGHAHVARELAAELAQRNYPEMVVALSDLAEEIERAMPVNQAPIAQEEFA